MRSLVLGAAITVATVVRMRANRLARRVTRLQSAALTTVLCGTIVLASGAVSGLTASHSPRIEKPNLAPIEDQRVASLNAKTEAVSANTGSVDSPQPTAIDKNGTSDADMVTTAAGTIGSDRSESLVETVVVHSPQKLSAETPPMQMAASTGQVSVTLRQMSSPLRQMNQRK